MFSPRDRRHTVAVHFEGDTIIPEPLPGLNGWVLQFWIPMTTPHRRPKLLNLVNAGADVFIP